jgi:hypothetical protein
MEKWEKTESYILLVTILVAGIVSILDLIGVLTFFETKIATITLLVVALVAGSLLLGTYNTRQFMRSVLPVGAIRRFETSQQVLDYILFRIKQAKSSVCDITWADHHRSDLPFDGPERERYCSIIEELSKNRVAYRELMMFCGSENRIDKARRLVKSTGKGYRLRAVPDLPEGPPHRWNFVIIDGEEVILNKLAVRQNDIVDYFTRCFNDQWAAAAKWTIKAGDTGGTQELEEFLARHTGSR